MDYCKLWLELIENIDHNYHFAPNLEPNRRHEIVQEMEQMELKMARKDESDG